MEVLGLNYGRSRFLNFFEVYSDFIQNFLAFITKSTLIAHVYSHIKISSHVWTVEY
jgi:hypothetical protein